MEEPIERLESELIELFQDESVEVKRILYCSKDFSIVPHPMFTVAGPERRTTYEHIGEFAGVEVYDRLVPENGPYKIIYEDYYKECDECSLRKMFDETNKTYYCPRCDNTRQRLKDKVYKYVG